MGYKPGYEPSDEELRGAHGIIKPAASEILKSKLPSKPQPYTLAPGQIRFSAQNEPVAQGESMGDVYKSIPEANAAWSRMVAADPEMASRYRPEIKPDPQRGGYTLHPMSNEPLSQGLPFWIQEYNNPGTPPARKLQLAAMIKQYADVQYPIAERKAAGTTAGTPLSSETQTTLRPLQAADAALAALEGFTDAEKRSFIGLYNRNVKDIASVAQEIPIVGSYVKAVGPKFAVDRYNEFKALSGQVEKMEFSYGGKQLTATEQKVVVRGIVTGKEDSYAEYQGKAKFTRGLLQAERDVALYLATTPKEQVTPASTDKIYRDAIKRNQIDLGQGYMKFLSPDDRLKVRMNK